MKPTVSPDQYDAKSSRLIKKEAYCVGMVVSLSWPVCFDLLSRTCEGVLIKQVMV